MRKSRFHNDKHPPPKRGLVTSSSSFFVSSSMRRMSSIDRSIHLSIQQNSCLWKRLNKRFSTWTDKTDVWESETEEDLRLDNSYRKEKPPELHVYYFVAFQIQCKNS